MSTLKIILVVIGELFRIALRLRNISQDDSQGPLLTRTFYITRNVQKFKL